MKAKKLINLIGEQFHTSIKVKSQTGLDSDTIDVFKNPTLSELRELMKSNTINGEDDSFIRAFLCDNLDIYIFNSPFITHNKIRPMINISGATIPLYLSVVDGSVNLVVITDTYKYDMPENPEAYINNSTNLQKLCCKGVRVMRSEDPMKGLER